MRGLERKEVQKTIWKLLHFILPIQKVNMNILPVSCLDHTKIVSLDKPV